MENEKQQIIEDLNYLYSKINWGESFLDAKAIQAMNTLSARILALGENGSSDGN